MRIYIGRSDMAVSDGRAYTVHPDIMDQLARSDKGGTVELFGVQIIFDFLRGISAIWQDIGDSLRSKAVAKAGLVAIWIDISRLRGVSGSGSGAQYGRHGS